MILEINDQDLLQALEALSEVGIAATVRDDREVTWVGDSLLQALFEFSEIADELRDDLFIDIPKMASDIEWMLFEGESSKLILMDQMRKEFFYGYVRKRLLEMSREKGVVSIFTKL